MNTARFLPAVAAVIWLTPLFLSGCQRELSSDVNQDKIYAEYELFYNANEDITYARAVFRFNESKGQKLRLADGSEVRFNGDLLTFKPALAYYEKSYPGQVMAGDFMWEDTNGKQYSNTISLPVIAFPAMSDTIPRNAPFELVWVGDSLLGNDMVTIRATGANELDMVIVHQDLLHSNSIVIPMLQLQTLGQGSGLLKMTRTFSPQLIHKTSAGGTITGRYRPINKEVWFD